ncbi:hypothetical protein GCM10010293_51270 [Streptomyces griseoflavus]|nr:hypothetical protein GCM10010293_51270 [Streptomyces griseoflavus]
MAAAVAVPVSSGLPARCDCGRHPESAPHDRPSSDDDPVAPHRPADELDTFNAHVVGEIQVIRAFRQGEGTP